MNTLVIAGTVGKDAELRSAGGEPVCSFSVSVSNGKDKSGAYRESTWVECSLWGTRAEKIYKNITKGTKLSVSGKASVRAYVAKDGAARGSLELRVNEFTFMGGGERSTASARGGDDFGAKVDDGDQLPF